MSIQPTFCYTRLHKILSGLARQWENSSRSGDIENLRGAEWVRGVSHGVRLAIREMERYNMEVKL